MVVREVRKTILPEIPDHHTVKIETDKVAETEVGKHEHKADKRESRDRTNRGKQPGRVIENVVDRVEIGCTYQRHAARYGVQTNQQCQSEAFLNQLTADDHVVFAPAEPLLIFLKLVSQSIGAYNSEF